jgi:lysophospholipase L1-like esterase
MLKCFTRIFVGPLISLLFAPAFSHGQPASTPTNSAAGWVGTWGCAPQLTEIRNLPPPPGLTSNTLRQVVHVSIGGKLLRVRFSNTFGDSPVTLSSTHLARSAGGNAIQPETDKALTFDGKPSVTIPAGAMTVSDTLDFDLAPLTDVAVTIHFGETSSAVTGHPGSRTTSYLQAGDATAATNLQTATKTEHWYILNGIDVLRPEDSAAAIVTLGDSITDGRGSTTDRNNRWPDDLASRLKANPETANIAVLNMGIGGNCVLRGGLGPTALARLDRDVLSQNGVRWVIVLEGVNDIGGSRGDEIGTNVAAQLIAAFEQIIAKAHAGNLRVYGATILPFEGSGYFSPGHEAARQAVNQWIRTSGKFDAVIDLDASTRDPEKPLRLIRAADSGDHLHPSAAGYQKMADAIDLKLFAK